MRINTCRQDGAFDGETGLPRRLVPPRNDGGACAIQAEVDVFVTTDDRLLRLLRAQHEIRAMLPGDALAYLENWYEN
jgi:hypothetical protein